QSGQFFVEPGCTNCINYNFSIVSNFTPSGPRSLGRPSHESGMNRLMRHLLPFRPNRPAQRRSLPPGWRPPLRLLSLDDRITPNTYLVTTAADSGTGSLRDAIGLANGNVGADTIAFDTAGVFATPQTISLLTALPTIGDSLTVTGTGAAQLTVRR